ncbi:HalOD1 output domain-containing protein [Haloarcula argentinensis]|uniref:HalOD1 output domain-containing protein n=1 Tax=Haloarcula argentinensis TaxID=43776 RepID=UPI001F113DCD|nr:HalOD1 output domain-containing protein [Haloarcula argentinensis]
MSKSNRWSRDGDTPTSMNVTRKQFDWSETRPSAAVTEYISAMTGREQTDFAPLYETIDPEALDSLLDSPKRSTPVSISFEYAGHSVTVRSDGELVIEAPSSSIGR